MIVHLAFWTGIFYLLTWILYPMLVRTPVFERIERKQGGFFCPMFLFLPFSVLILRLTIAITEAANKY